MAEGKKVIAVTEIHRTLAPGEAGDKSKGIRPKPPKVQIIAPKTVFMASTVKDRDDDTSEFDRLLKSGAIREPEKDEKVAVNIENIVPDDDANAKKTNAEKAVNAKSNETTGTKAGENKGSGETGGSTSTKPTGSKGETTTTGTTKSGSKASGAEGAGDDLV